MRGTRLWGFITSFFIALINAVKSATKCFAAQAELWFMFADDSEENLKKKNGNRCQSS